MCRTFARSVANGSVEITVDAQGDADVDLWAARSKVKLFEKVFDREVVFLRQRCDQPSAAERPRPLDRIRHVARRRGDANQDDDPVDAAGNRARPR